MTHPTICPCGGALDSDKLRCSTCRSAVNQTQKQRYAELKAKGLCTWCEAPAMILPDGTVSQFCRPHRIARNKYLGDRKTRREKSALAHKAKNPGQALT